MTSYKMVGLVCVRRWENENRSNIYERVIKWVVYKLEVLNHVTSDIYFELRYWKILSIKIVQLWSKYLYLYKFKPYIDLNILIKFRQCLCLKCFITLDQNMFPVGKMFQYRQFVYYYFALTTWSFRVYFSAFLLCIMHYLLRI